MDECLYHRCKLWSQRILTLSKPLSHYYGLRVEGDWKDLQKLLKINLTLGMMSAEGQGYPEVTKLGSSSHTT